MRSAALVLFAIAAGAAGAFAATMPAVRMKVADAADASPVAGAFVLFQASAREGTFTGHGGRGALLFAAEAVSGPDGEFRIPAQEFNAMPFFLNTNYENPRMVVFKPGYDVLVLYNERTLVPELQDMTRWERNETTVKLPRGAGDRETNHAVHWAAMYAGFAIPDCAWTKIPRFLVAVDRAVDEWNRRRTSVQDRELSFRQEMSPLQLLLRNEAWATQGGCASPKAFFAPYLH